MPLLRDLYSLKFNILATHELFRSLLRSMITNDINFVLEICCRADRACTVDSLEQLEHAQ